ncbi:MAG TPA: peptidoglycan-associated lipoprotein Pal [Terriglobales bacterium]|nr:peptidoglycan-associated lipoprotein Pal [Terriglobales bacterium]
MHSKKPSSRSLVVAVASVFLLTFGMAACGKKAAPPPPPPAPPPAAAAPAPTVTLNASPTSIQSGESSTLSWSSENAVKVEMDGAAVNLNGSQAVSPTDSTNYQITATSADGRTATAAARITVTQPPPPPVAAPPTTSDIGTFEEKVRDAFFDYDKSDIRPDAQMTLQADAAFLKQHPEISVQIVGHCDARGSAEYNLALGSRRAESVKQFLVSQGVDAGRITTNSVGKEQPFCTETTEDCYQQNRRGHLVKGGQ